MVYPLWQIVHRAIAYTAGYACISCVEALYHEDLTGLKVQAVDIDD